MTTTVNIERKRGDTKAIVFVITDENDAAVDISSWSSFLLTINSEKKPVNTDNQVQQIIGALVTTGTDGKVGFSPDGTSAVGSYFYDAQAIDGSGGKCTFAEGKYKITQDITKD